MVNAFLTANRPGVRAVAIGGRPVFPALDKPSGRGNYGPTVALLGRT
jgi:hypothetical protein